MVDAFIINDDYVGPQSEILPGMFLGCEEDGQAFQGPWIAVHGECRAAKAVRIPVMEPTFDDDGFFHGDSTVANRNALDAATSLMRAFQQQGLPQIITCRMGIERSPLTFAHFLVRYKYAANFDDAYRMLESKRVVVERRTHWLPKKSMPHGALA